MNELFEKVAERLDEQVSELKWIDWEIGQLDSKEENLPFQFPAALVDIESVEWSNTIRNLQEGVATVAVRVIFGIWKDFSSYPPDYTEAAQLLILLNKVQAALQGYKSDHFSELNRTRTAIECKPNGYKTATLYYETTLCDSNGMPTYIPVSVDSLTVKPDIA